MSGNSKRRIGGVAITGLVIAGVVAVSSMSASGEGPVEASGPIYVPYGTLTINLTDRDGTYELRDPGDERVGDPETIATNQPCATVDPDSGDLVVLTPNPASPTNGLDTVQVRNSGFGVNTGNTSCGSSSAALLSGAEQLQFELGTALPADVYIESADLKWTQTKAGELKWVLPNGDSGATAIGRNGTPEDETARATTIEELSDLFRSFTVESTAKKDNEGISIADGTTFNLVQLDPDFDVAVDCGEFVPAPTVIGGIATAATYERLDNKTDDVLCDDVGVRVQIQEAGGDVPFDRVFWNNDFTGVEFGEPQTVQAYFTIEWAPAELADLDREIDYTGEAASGTPMLWCAGKDLNGIPILPLDDAPGSIDATPDVANDGLRAPWCLVQDDRTLQPDGTIVQVQTLFGSGDPWAR